MGSVQCLRAAVHQLTSTPTAELPFIASYLSSTLANCGPIISSPDTGGQDAPLLIQRLKARITSLLQDKTVEGRWTGVVLVKAVVESGRWEILRGSEQWVRGLLGILAKADPTTTKKLCVITLTRIYLLTHRYQSLVREITTPTLPSFITACLNLVSRKTAQQETRKLKPNAKLLEPVLCSFINLLPNHATIFRTFSAQIHDLVLPLLAPSQSQFAEPDSTVELAQRVFVSLHHCAPKNAAGDEWSKACRNTILSIHQTASCLFRAIIEQWEPADPSVREVLRKPPSGGRVGDANPDPLGLPSWTGINQGSRKIACLLRLLSRFMLSRTSSTVAVPVGSMLDLTARLTSLTVPPPGVDVSGICNPEIGKDERESLWNALPSIHSATINLLQTIVETFSVGAVPIVQSCLDQAFWVFESEVFCRDIRTSTYGLLDAALQVTGFNLTKSDISSLTPTVRALCRDLQQARSGKNVEPAKTKSSKRKSKVPNGTANADDFLNLGSSGPSEGAFAGRSPGYETETDLLTTFLSFLPAELLPVSLRAELDRTAILLQIKQSMIASVVNPIPASGKQRGHASILPFLSRSYPGDVEVEGLLRPRLPVLMHVGAKGTVDFGAREDEQDVDTQAPTLDWAAMARPALEASGVDATASASVPEATGNHPSTKPSEFGIKRPFERDAGIVDAPPSTEVASQGKRLRTDTDPSGNFMSARDTPDILDAPRHIALGTSREQGEGPPPTTIPPAVVPPPPVAAPSNQESATSFKASSSLVSQPQAHEDAEESDEEIPTLNLEPDTDEEDEDEMVE